MEIPQILHARADIIITREHSTNTSVYHTVCPESGVRIKPTNLEARGKVIALLSPTKIKKQKFIIIISQ